MKLQEKINQLEQEIEYLRTKVNDLSRNVEEKTKTPYSIAGGGRNPALNKAIDISTGKSVILSGSVIWNDAESQIPRYGQVAPTPTRGYNKHSHSRYSGGALMINALELVEYDSDTIENPHCQQFNNKTPKIATIKHTVEGREEIIEKIGLLDIAFNPTTRKWGTSSTDIDVETTYLVRKVTEQGNAYLRSKGL